ncbi:MAG: cupin [Rhodobacteraceae bacterium]|nr:cupin [Paracoccaceae bacterium]
MSDTIAEMRLPTQELREDIPFFTKTLKMRMDMIYPADNPSVAVFSGHGLRLRIEKGAPERPGTIRILTADPDGFADGQRLLTAPNGTRIEIEARYPPLVLPETQHSFVVRRLADEAPWIIGRAGMHYRDLVPTRLGGSIIASHIRIPEGGPVPDMVHFHKVGFQLIFCILGWVDVIYEDQGDAIRLHPGDCVIQPPEIRHRVLEASDDLQVIEIGVPAEHLTEIDHEMTLPTAQYSPDREWDGQKFVCNRATDADWQLFRLPGFSCRDTTIAANTGGVANVQVVRRGEGVSPWAAHDADILFTFVMGGQVILEGEGRDPIALSAGDAYVIPPDLQTRLSEPSEDLELLEVALPGHFNTHLG